MAEPNPFAQFDGLRDRSPPPATGAPGSGDNFFAQFDDLRDSAPKSSGWSIARQVPAGFNEGLADVAGAPVDAMTWALNRVPQAVNAIGGREIIPPIKRPFGGSESIKSGMGLIGANPDDVPARTAGERIARGVGGGVAAMLAPEAAAGMIARAGPAAAKAMEPLARVFGRTETAGDLATATAAGAAGGAGGEAAAEFAPDQYKPLARTVGNLAAGVPVAAAPAFAQEAARLGKNFIAPMHEAGREELAGGRLARAATDVSAVREALDGGAGELVPGSKPTTFQLTGDTGLGSLEREIQTRNPADFAERRGEQNAARVKAIEGIQPTGAPEEVSNLLRGRLADIDRTSQQAVDAATNVAQGRAADLGGQAVPNEHGAALRSALQEAEDTARASERGLWNAVDPDRTLTVSMAPVRNAERSVYGNMTAAAEAGLSPAETTIRRVIGTYQGVEPFRELSDLRSAISSAMRAELRTTGNSPAYARLTQLRGAVERSIASTIEQRSAQEAQAVAQGRMSPQDTIAARVAAPQTGNEVFTPSGRRISVDYRIANGADLVTSHRADMSPNPGYPSELQPRDRTRAASETQVARMAGNLQPERLGASASAAEGAPIIGPDGVVESGNARVLAIRRAHRENGPAAAAYRDFLQSQGFDTRGIPEPVLVRQRQTDLSPTDRVRFSQEANAAPGLSMSASERAAADAGRLPDGVLELYRGGDLGSAENRDFVRAFLRSVPERGEEGGFATREGSLSLEGGRRIQNALVHAAYGDSNLVARLAEAGDENIRGLGSALTDAAGDMAQLRRGIASGAVSPRVDIAPSLLRAVDRVGQARSRGVPLASVMSQRDAFAVIDPIAESVLKSAYGRDYSGRLAPGRFAGFLRDYVKEASQQTTAARLFGEPLESSQILESIGRRYGRTSEGGGPGAGAVDMGESSGTARSPGPGFATGAPRARSAGQSQGADVLERPELAPNFDAAAQERLNAATAATRERARTFGQGPVGQILRTQGDRGNFRMAASAVPGNIFRPGPGGYEAVQAFRRAAGDDADAAATLQDAVAASARRFAQRPDGAIDPGRLARWRNAHADALRAVPGDVARDFVDAGRATAAIDAAATARREALDTYQRGAIGKLIGVRDPADVTKTIGGVFARNDAVGSMRRLAQETAQNPDARDGLRKAVVDYMYGRFVSNTEAATSRVGQIKNDTFQSFVRNNRAALREVLSEAEVNGLSAIAADLQRAARSLSAIKIPGQSNTAQDTIAALEKKSGGHGSLLTQAIIAAGAGYEVHGLHGAALGLAGAFGKYFTHRLREAGMDKVEDLVKQAMFDPETARHLLSRAPPNSTASNAAKMKLAQRLARLSVFEQAQDQRKESRP